MELILASTSPRRRELIKKIVNKFTVIKPVCDEVIDGSPYFIAKQNALLKGRSVKGDFVLACDTIVALDNTIFGKPKNKDEAFSTLKKLSGKTHKVISGVYIRYKTIESIFTDTSYVTFKKLTDIDINNYINRFNPYDKAGSYAIQDNMVVDKYEGSLDNIIGLPVERIIEELNVIKPN